MEFHIWIKKKINKGIIIIVHTLSGVKNSDKIIVIDSKIIPESSSHLEIINLNKKCKELIEN